MNLIVTRRPSRLNWSDSCPFGLRGFLLKSGRAWRLRIPKESILYGSPKINNLLEFLGMAVNIWLECLDADKQDCILSIGDNTLAVRWLHNSSRLSHKCAAHEAHLVVARISSHSYTSSQTIKKTKTKTNTYTIQNPSYGFPTHPAVPWLHPSPKTYWRRTAPLQAVQRQ
jgi:hypothetical protein